MAIATERAYSTPFDNSTLLPLLLISLATQKHSPDTAKCVHRHYDYIVVGAGSAGSVVASRLSENPLVSVLLLEAGPPPPLLTEVPSITSSFSNTDIDWKFKTVPQKYGGYSIINREMAMSSGKTLGGTSILNGMVYIRGNRKNYDNWAENGAKGWSYDEVFPYFLKLENNSDSAFVANAPQFHNVNGPMSVERSRYQSEIKGPLFQAIRDMGYRVVDPNAATETGFYDFQVTMRKGQRCSTAKAYLVPAEHRKNLDIFPNAMVTKVLIRNNRACGVRFDHRNTTYKVRARKEVIISAGTINTPQLLMLSGIGPRKELEKFNIPVVADLPVGRNLQDHPGCAIAFLLDPNIVQPLPQKLKNPAYMSQYIESRTGLLASDLFSVLAFLEKKIRPQTDFPTFSVSFGEASADALRHYDYTPETYAQVYAPYEGKPLYICLIGVLQPRSRGTVTLRSKDAYDLPIIDPNYYEHPEDIKDMVDGLNLCIRIGNSTAMRRVGSTPLDTLLPGCEELAGDQDAYLSCYAKSIFSSLNHPVGTARMGNPKDPRTVVDPQLRVKTVEGLRVVDASVMPIITSANTNIPTIMIAEKASDMIKEHASGVGILKDEE